MTNKIDVKENTSIKTTEDIIKELQEDISKCGKRIEAMKKDISVLKERAGFNIRKDLKEID